MNFEPGKLTANRLYYCRVSVAGQTIERPFYYGDLDAGYQRPSKRAERFFAADASVSIDLKAQLARLKHLLVPESRLNEFWSQKVAAIFAELEDGLAALGTSVKAFHRVPGSHIRGYAIVVVLPFITTANEPFLESFYLAAFDENERYRILGDEYGFAVLQESADFVARCQKVGVGATLVRVQGGYHGYWQDPMGERRAMFEFYRGKQRSAARKLVPPALPFRIRAGHGPIEECRG